MSSVNHVFSLMRGEQYFTLGHTLGNGSLARKGSAFRFIFVMQDNISLNDLYAVPFVFT